MIQPEEWEDKHIPYGVIPESIEVAPDVFFSQQKTCGNTGFVITPEGVVLIDTGDPNDPRSVLRRVRRLTELPIRYIIYTSGKISHAANALPLLEEAKQRHHARPIVIAHESVRASFLSSGHSVPPDLTYTTDMLLEIGAVTLHLHRQIAAPDGTWVHLPAHQLIFGGDLFLRSCEMSHVEVEASEDLNQVRATQASLLLPGHGLPLTMRELLSGHLPGPFSDDLG